MIHIVTPTTRGDRYLNRCYRSIREHMRGVMHQWFVVLGEDAPEPAIAKGQNVRVLRCPRVNNHNIYLNHYLDTIPVKGQWMWVLDDDNLVHPGLSDMVYQCQGEDRAGVVFSQQLENGTRAPDFVPTKVDQAQFILRRSAIAELRYWELYRGDGYFMMEFYIRHKMTGLLVPFLPDIGCYYNAQHWLPEER